MDAWLGADYKRRRADEWQHGPSTFKQWTGRAFHTTRATTGAIGRRRGRTCYNTRFPACACRSLAFPNAAGASGVTKIGPGATTASTAAPSFWFCSRSRAI